MKCWVVGVFLLPLCCLFIHDQRDVALDQGEGEEADVVRVFTGCSRLFLPGKDKNNTVFDWTCDTLINFQLTFTPFFWLQQARTALQTVKCVSSYTEGPECEWMAREFETVLNSLCCLTAWVGRLVSIWRTQGFPFKKRRFWSPCLCAMLSLGSLTMLTVRVDEVIELLSVKQCAHWRRFARMCPSETIESGRHLTSSSNYS